MSLHSSDNLKYKQVGGKKNGMESCIPSLNESKYSDVIDDMGKWSNDLIVKMVIRWKKGDSTRKHDQDNLRRILVSLTQWDLFRILRS